METDIYRGMSEIEIARVQGRAEERTHIRRMVACPIGTLQQLQDQSIKDGTDYCVVLSGVIAQLQICVRERSLT